MSVVGAGSWGTTLAKLLAEKEAFKVNLWVRKAEQVEIIKKQQESIYYLPYTNEDIVGVELGGTFKNIIVVAIGLLNGLGYKDNIKAATMTRGLAEISRLGLAMGAQAETFRYRRLDNNLYE